MLVAAFVVALACRAVLVSAIHHLNPPNWHIFGPDIFYVLLGVFEPAAYVIVLGAALLFILIHLFDRSSGPVAIHLTVRSTLLIALAVFCFCFWATGAVYLHFPLTLDENAAFFQAGVFRSGHITAAIPPSLEKYRDAIVPGFMEIHANRVLEGYLPIYSSLVAAAWTLLGSLWVLNPLMCAGSVLLIYGVGRNLGYSVAFTGWAVALLVTSCQFLVNGFSAYAMPSHLFFNLAWLYCYTHPNRRLFYLAPPLGVLAIGLHQPICHILFVVPFLLRLVQDRKWREAFYAAAVYLVGGLCWIYWMGTMRPDANHAIVVYFAVPGMESGFIFFLSLLNLISWQNFLMILLLIAALANWRLMPAFVRDLTFSAGLTAIFYLFFIRSQGSGWGYRYMHPVFANLVLIAAWGGIQFTISRTNFAVMALLALGLQLPLRCYEVQKVVGRQAAAYHVISHLDTDFVIIDRARGYSAVELMRNDPDFQNRPIFMFRSGLSDEQFRDLMQSGHAVFISRPEFRQLGVPVLP